VTATALLEHALRPLAAPPPRHGVAHAVSGGVAVLPGLAGLERYEVPLLLTEHGVYLRERYLGYRTAPYRWPVKAVVLGFFRLLAEESYRRAALITPGNRYNRLWEEQGGADPRAIRTVYNGVDPAAFPPAGPEPDLPTLSWAGRVDPIKDLETLIRAFALVRKEIPEARLRLFGGTPRGGEAYRERCEALAAELGHADAVTFEGRVEDIKDAYAAGNVVMLSSISEGFPFTLIEAMSCGRATVSTDVGGVREAVG
ncbi:GT4 family glycosyltransferase PelF, partial [Streptomyces tricolor]